MINKYTYGFNLFEIISESDLFEYPQNQQNKIQELFETYGLTYHIVSLAAALYSNNCLDKDIDITHHKNKLQNIFNNISDLTLKEDMLMKLR